MNDNQAATLALQVGLKAATLSPALMALIGGVGGAVVPTAVGAGIGALSGDSEVVDPRDGTVLRKGTRGRNALIGAGVLGIPAGLMGALGGYAAGQTVNDVVKNVDSFGRELAPPPSAAADALYKAFRTKSDALPLNDPKHMELQLEFTRALHRLNETQ